MNPTEILEKISKDYIIANISSKELKLRNIELNEVYSILTSLFQKYKKQEESHNEFINHLMQIISNNQLMSENELQKLLHEHHELQNEMIIFKDFLLKTTENSQINEDISKNEIDLYQFKPLFFFEPIYEYSELILMKCDRFKINFKELLELVEFQSSIHSSFFSFFNEIDNFTNILNLRINNLEYCTIEYLTQSIQKIIDIKNILEIKDSKTNLKINSYFKYNNVYFIESDLQKYNYIKNNRYYLIKHNDVYIQTYYTLIENKLYFFFTNHIIQEYKISDIKKLVIVTIQHYSAHKNIYNNYKNSLIVSEPDFLIQVDEKSNQINKKLYIDMDEFKLLTLIFLIYLYIVINNRIISKDDIIISRKEIAKEIIYLFRNDKQSDFRILIDKIVEYLFYSKTFFEKNIELINFLRFFSEELEFLILKIQIVNTSLLYSIRLILYFIYTSKKYHKSEIQTTLHFDHFINEDIIKNIFVLFYLYTNEQLNGDMNDQDIDNLSKKLQMKNGTIFMNFEIFYRSLFFSQGLNINIQSLYTKQIRMNLIKYLCFHEISFQYHIPTKKMIYIIKILQKFNKTEILCMLTHNLFFIDDISLQENLQYESITLFQLTHSKTNYYYFINIYFFILLCYYHSCNYIIDNVYNETIKNIVDTLSEQYIIDSILFFKNLIMDGIIQQFFLSLLYVQNQKDIILKNNLFSEYFPIYNNNTLFKELINRMKTCIKYNIQCDTEITIKTHISYVCNQIEMREKIILPDILFKQMFGE